MKSWRDISKRLSFKKRIFIFFLAGFTVPVLCVGLISYFTIHAILDNKVETGIRSNLQQLENSMVSLISNLNHVSQILAYEGTLGSKIARLQTVQDPSEKVLLIDEIKQEINLISFTNPNTGLVLYYDGKTGQISFENFSVKSNFAPKELPLLDSYYGISYYGPHPSNNGLRNEYVFSALRKVEMPGENEMYIYIETGFNVVKNLLNAGESQYDIKHLILDKNGRIAYSEDQSQFPLDQMFGDDSSGLDQGEASDYYWFQSTSNQGWSVVSVISKSDYNREMNQWLQRVFLFAAFLLLITILLAWLLWKMVYKPLHTLHREIKQMEQTDSQAVVEYTRIPEFDYLLQQFQQMKKKIWELFAEVEHKEKRRADLEVEKLMYQINPHFLMNTLDTVHWLAMMNGQKDIDRLVLSLNKLLYYNLGKLGQTSTVKEEIEALREYITLQQIRYDFQFEVDVRVDEQVLHMPIPRFILQPIVENALYHGFKDNGYIKVNVTRGSHIEICVQDNGGGMTEETIQALLNSRQQDAQKVGMGIGLNYVKRMIQAQYGERARLHVESVIGGGTRFHLSLPIVEEVASHAESIGRG